MSMRITVAICTWNRARLLDQTLAKMRHLRVPEGAEWELLVVNNNCTDDTDAVLSTHQGHLPLRRLFEAKQGQSNARNHAVACATGDLIVWTDDDVLVDSDWLVHYARAARDWPHVSYFGGTIDPWFSRTPPRWIRRHLRRLQGPFAIRQLGEETRLLHDDEEVFGANMAFRAEVAKRYLFNPRMGLVGNNSIRGDETELIQRIKADGGCGLWVGPARVLHYISPERLTLRYIRSYIQGISQTWWRLQAASIPYPLLCGVPRWAVKQYVIESCHYYCRLPFKDTKWFEIMICLANLRGMMSAYRELLSAPPQLSTALAEQD